MAYRRGNVFYVENEYESKLNIIPTGYKIINRETNKEYILDRTITDPNETLLKALSNGSVKRTTADAELVTEKPSVSSIGSVGETIDFNIIIENYTNDTVYTFSIDGINNIVVPNSSGVLTVKAPTLLKGVTAKDYKWKLYAQKNGKAMSLPAYGTVNVNKLPAVSDLTDSVGTSDGVLLYENTTMPLLGKTVVQEDGETDFVKSITELKYQLPKLEVSSSSTATKLVNYNKPYVSGTPVKVYNAKDGLVDGTLGTTAQEEVSVNTPNYQSKFHKHNITKETTVNNITGWTTGTPLPGDLSRSQAIVTKSRVYLLGGDTYADYTDYTLSTVYTAPINRDGTLGSWTTGTPLPAPLGYSQAIVTKNRVYLLGGYNGNGDTSTVYTAPINTDGTLGSWTTGTSLPAPLYSSQAIVTKNRVYLLGGSKGNGNTSTVYTAPINTDGTLGSWTTGTSLPVPLAYSQAIVTKSRVYLLGGDRGNIVSTVYTAPFADGWEIQENNYQIVTQIVTHKKYTADITALRLTNAPTKAWLYHTITTTTAVEDTQGRITNGLPLTVNSATNSSVTVTSNIPNLLVENDTITIDSGTVSILSVSVAANSNSTYTYKVSYATQPTVTTTATIPSRHIELQEASETLENDIFKKIYQPLEKQGRAIQINVHHNKQLQLKKVSTVLYKRGV